VSRENTLSWPRKTNTGRLRKVGREGPPGPMDCSLRHRTLTVPQNLTCNLGYTSNPNTDSGRGKSEENVCHALAEGGPWEFKSDDTSSYKPPALIDSGKTILKGTGNCARDMLST
jgi:hypothetical protein